MSEQLVIQSHRGPYIVSFDDEAFRRLGESVSPKAHYLIDKRVAELYSAELGGLTAAHSILRIEAIEENKSLENMPQHVANLVAKGIRRGHVLIAIGGGIIQDIACFLSATLLRGLEWHFYPTTLLAQADSCIGSKSSINVGGIKNILGTYTPPLKVFITTRVLATLEEKDVRSGLGEMLKVHAIESPESFDRIAKDYDNIFADHCIMKHYILRSLAIKKSFIEQDEFDCGIRNVMNYGHSIGHAIESATDFAVPHGVAVTLGMDLANYIAVQRGMMAREHYDRMHCVLRKNYASFKTIPVPMDAFISSISKDKKNREDSLRLVLPDDSAKVSVVTCRNDDVFRTMCMDYFAAERNR